MILLMLSILGLGLGPILDRFVRQRSVVVAFLEGFVAATILALVMGHILPEAVETGGWICLPIALVGLIGPQLAEAWRHTRAFRIHGTVAVLALAGLCLHTLMDGAALADAHHHAHEAASTALGIGVVLHRLPVGLTVWWLVQRSTGTAAAVAVLTAICIGTLIGFAAGEAIVAHLSTASIALFQSFVGGSLVHVVLHRSLSEDLAPAEHHAPGGDGRFNWSGAGALVGIGLLLLVPLSGHAAESRTGVADTFLRYWMSAAPALLAGFCALGLLQALAGGQPGACRGPVGFLTGCLSGPLSTDRTDRSRPFFPPRTSRRAVLVYLVAIPLLGLDILLFSVPMLGPTLALVRVAAIVVVALLVGLLPETSGGAPQPHGEEHPAPPPEPPPRTRGAAFRLGLGRAVDRTAPWLLIGFLSAALLEVFLSSEWISTLPAGADLMGLTLLGAAISLPATTALPIALALLRKGISSGAAIALLIAGPALTRATSRSLVKTFGKPAARLFWATVAGGALLTGLYTNRLFPLQAGPEFPAGPIPLWREACGILLLFLFVLSLLRLGPAGMVAQLGHGHTHDHHDHH